MGCSFCAYSAYLQGFVLTEELPRLLHRNLSQCQILHILVGSWASSSPSTSSTSRNSDLSRLAFNTFCLLLDVSVQPRLIHTQTQLTHGSVGIETKLSPSTLVLQNIRWCWSLAWLGVSSPSPHLCQGRLQLYPDQNPFPLQPLHSSVLTPIQLGWILSSPTRPVPSHKLCGCQWLL